MFGLWHANRNSGPSNYAPDRCTEEPDRSHRRAAQPDCESTAGLIRSGSLSTKLGRRRHVRSTSDTDPIADVASGPVCATFGSEAQPNNENIKGSGLDGPYDCRTHRVPAYQPTPRIPMADAPVRFLEMIKDRFSTAKLI